MFKFIKLKDKNNENDTHDVVFRTDTVDVNEIISVFRNFIQVCGYKISSQESSLIQSEFNPTLVEEVHVPIDLSEHEITFITNLASKRKMNIGGVIKSIISEYIDSSSEFESFIENLKK